ncbi:MAG TPA: serine/threonine-protein kinase, partial [candidate division Zixibacteria bacterium]|nr:serine/threonine-protein kinase [candidate division Zixibacteria bacterium]
MESEKIGRYQLLELIGRGAIGDVYRAHDPDLDREVAVKIITRSTSMDSAEVQRRFRREVQLAAYLKHPNIISVYDVGLDQEQPYLVTELLAGGTLKDYFGLGLLVWEEALALLEPISSALGYAHEVGIIHRDVKPGNIMFADDGTRTIKLADFGLAHRQDDDQLTQSGGIVGTIAYMSPEQANGEALDARTDIYSLGLILFEAIAGYNPLRGETVSRTLLNAISFDPIDLSGLLDKVPRDVLALLGSALARDRRTRYGSCRQLSQDIARCLALNEQPLPGGSKIARDLLADVSGTSRTVQIENVLGLSLPADADEILQEMFAGYRRVSIKE